MTVSNLLQEARALVERGWGQWNFLKDGQYCVIGALSTAGENYSYEVEMLAENMLWRHSGCGGSLPYWNDQSGRTKEEVLALFDRALTEVTK